MAAPRFHAGRGPGARPRHRRRLRRPTRQAAHRAGVEFVSRVLLETLDEPVDAVITTSAGYPLDLTFYQSHQRRHRRLTHRETRRPDSAGGAPARKAPARPKFARMMLEGIRRPRLPAHASKVPPVTVDQWQLEKLALVTTRAEPSLVRPRPAGRVSRPTSGAAPACRCLPLSKRWPPPCLRAHPSLSSRTAPTSSQGQ